MSSPSPRPEQLGTSVWSNGRIETELPDLLRQIAQHKREFVVYDDGWRGWAYQYSDIARMARAFAFRLRSYGLTKGDAIIVWSESRPGWVAALWACLEQGIVLVPVDPQASAKLFHRIEEKVHPRLIVLGDSVAGTEATGLVPVCHIREIETARDQREQEPVPHYTYDTAEIVFTSGTTAEPKGVVMTYRNLAASLRPLADQVAPYKRYFRLLAPLRVLNLLPMSHLFGQAVALFLVPLIPASVVFLSTTNPEEIARQIRTKRMCALVSVPKVLEVLRDFIVHRFPATKDAVSGTDPKILEWWRYRAVHRLFGWRFCCLVVGGAPLPAELEQFWSSLGFVVAQGYGLTETAPIISFSHPFHVQAGTTGKPIAGLEIKIAEDGEVLVRGDSVTPGYFQLPAESAAAFQDGWFRTGDIGELNAEGNLIIRGRKKEMIVTAEGLKVFPEDVEGVLNRIAGVRECAVLNRKGVHAVLVLEPNTEAEDIVRKANRQLEPHQRIRSVSVWQAEELPRTSTTHKLRRAEIAAALETGKIEVAAQPKTSLSQLVQRYAPGRTITPDTTLEDLGLSSLDRVELMMDLEQELDTSIDESILTSLSKVEDLARPTARAESTPQPTYNRKWWAKLIRRLVLPTIFLPLTRFFASLSVSGRKNLDNVRGPVIFVSNHQSHFDTPAILASLPPRWRYQIAPAMWKEYFEAHFFPSHHTKRERWVNSILYRLITVLFNAFPIPQVETGTRQSLRYLGELVEEGWSILIFPEGERTLTGEIGRFYPGVAMIAARMRLPVVPIRLIGLDQVLPRGSRTPRRGPVEVWIGPPMLLKGDSYTALTKQIEEAVRSLSAVDEAAPSRAARS